MPAAPQQKRSSSLSGIGTQQRLDHLGLMPRSYERSVGFTALPKPLADESTRGIGCECLVRRGTLPPAEEWRPVVGYEAYYEVSSLGRVRRIRKSRGAVVGRILTHCLS